MNTPEVSNRPRNINIQYDGTLSEHLVWELGTLAQAERVMDLRSHVVIKTGNERPQAETTSMGDILAWKAFGDPREMFKRQSRTNREMIIKDNLWTKGDAEVVLNDQVISDRIRKENNKFNEIKFTEELNRYVSSGLWQIATREKWITAINLARIHVPFVALATFTGGISVGAFELGGYALRTFPKDSSFFFALATGLVGLHGVFTTAMELLQWGLTMRDVKNGNFPYAKSYSDFNPLKHIGKAIDSAGYFLVPGRKFVTYEPIANST